MKLEEPKNRNYAATVVRVKNLIPLANSDNLLGMPMFGLQAIVGKDTNIDDLGVIFPAECQLSEAYTKANCLYRHQEFNEDKTKTGYLEDNRRVRAIKLRGNRSDALYMPLSSLEFTGAKLTELKEGDEFDVLNGIEICCKYVIVSREPRQRAQKVSQRVDQKFLPKHFDTTQWLKIADNYPDDTYVVVTQKLHGTSVRIGHTIVSRTLTWKDKLAKKLGVRVQETDFDYVYGSRTLIKDAENKNNSGYYDHDLWFETGKELKGKIPANYILYGEIIGWRDAGNPIQPHYTYDCFPKARRLYVYRVATINHQGTVADLSWEALKSFCQSIDVPHVAELWRGLKKDLDVSQFLNIKFKQQGYNAVPLSNDSPCDEGVCIRIEGMIPEIFKAKSPAFLAYETKMLDKGEADMEAV